MTGTLRDKHAEPNTRTSACVSPLAGTLLYITNKIPTTATGAPAMMLAATASIFFLHDDDEFLESGPRCVKISSSDL